MVYSLYGETRRPSKEIMDKIDIMSIDIQDCGSRYYTFIYTMAYCMQACAEFDKEFVVFDRPNPINCEKVEGNKLDVDKYRSFVGYYPIAQRHGMTMGELAKLFNEEYKINCKLTIIPMLNYERWMDFEDTKLPWEYQLLIFLLLLPLMFIMQHVFLKEQMFQKVGERQLLLS